ncbi:unnamed protein product [Spirodela intermedia]|uniref:Uncharacterized protein n=1 Tax=Spirodela intermedia TaxID=51605 RepID=A0A7I8IP57_SPIIN|nr:unnamed protein product [Spirodela intermedia]CAA6659728.1 unnamed protein product [Spirodela intermedia]
MSEGQLRKHSHIESGGLSLINIKDSSNGTIVQNKIIFFSKTGERAAPSLRQTAKDYSAYAAFAFVLWKEEESSVWWNMLEVESAPAIVVLKDPGVKPMVYHGSFHRSWFANIMEENKHQDLPQLRSITSMELGCDAMGHSRAGNSTLAWYCVVVAGRPSFQLNIMRETLRSVRKILMNDTEPDFAHENALQFPLSAANALKESRLTFAWLDGETQSKYCFFYLYLENSYETCGPRRHGDPIDVPKLFIVRYRRNSTENSLKPTKKVKSIWNRFEDEDVNLASQLVARYNGSDNLYEVIKWISQIIDDGDNRNLPYFVNNPDIPNEIKLGFEKSYLGVVLVGWRLKTKLQDIIQNVYSHTADPRLGPLFMLGACISFSTIWLRNGAGTRQTEDEDDTMVRRHYAAAMQAEPADARQILSTDSDSE